MAQEHSIVFEPFRLDVTQGRLWRGDQAIAFGAGDRKTVMLRVLF